MSIKIFTILLLLLSVFTARAQQNNQYTLQQCLDIAVQNNLNIKQTGLAMDQYQVNLKQAKENLLPAINGNVSRQLSQGRGISSVTNTYLNQSLTSDYYSLTGSLTLFNGLALQNAIKQASFAFQAGKMDFQAAKDVVTVNIITNYLLILDNEEILAQSNSQLAVAKEQVDRSEVLEQNGANKSPSDLYDLKGSFAGSQVNLVNSQNSLAAAKLSLFNLMNIPYNSNAEFQALNAQDLTGQYNVSPDQVYETALQQLALVKAATLRRESAEKGVKVAQGLLLPSLAINGGLTTTYSSAGQKSVFSDSTTSAVPGLYTNSAGGKQSIFSTQANYTNQNIGYADQFKNNYGTYVTLGLNIPIFTNHIKRNNVALAKINLLSYQNIEDNTKIQLKQSVEQAYYNMISAYNKYQALAQQVKAYTESFRISKIRFDSGVLTSVDFIIAKDHMDGANLNLISSRYDYFIYSKILDYYQGKLSL